MSIENQLSINDMVAYYACSLTQEFATPLAEISPALERAISEPRPVARMFVQYLRVVQYMANLTTDELDTIATVNGSINTGRLDSKQGADYFVAQLSQVISPSKFVRFIASAGSLSSTHYYSAISHLAEWLKTAHQYCEELGPGGRPDDADNRTRRMIWTATQVAEPEANYVTIQHVLACHGLERYLYHSLSLVDVEMAETKDFFVDALSDTIAFAEALHGEQSPFHDLAVLWQRPKEKGGLGWLSTRRIEAYREEIQKRK